MERLSNPYMNVEDELSIAIKAIGGCRVDELITKYPGHKNADFIFDRYGVVAELKCLEKDLMHDLDFVKKTSSIYEKYLKRKNVPFRVYGTVSLTTEKFSEEFQKEIADLYAVPIRRLIRDADMQISETNERFGSKHAGVLLLVNDGHTALELPHVRWSLSQYLHSGNFPNINEVVYFSVNMPVTLDDENILATMPLNGMDMHVWFEGGRADVPSIENTFMEDLRVAWFSHVSRLVGRSAEFHMDLDMVDRIKNKPNP